MVLFIIHGFTEEAIGISTPNLNLLQDKGAKALLNTRTGDGYHPQSTYLTIGSGRRAVSHRGEGLPILLEDGGLAYYPFLERLSFHNSRGDYGATPGLLGEILEEYSLQRVILTDSYNLNALFLLMDMEGKNPKTFLFSSEEEFTSLFQKALSIYHLILVDWDLYSPSDSNRDEDKLERVDRMLGLVMESLNPTCDLLLLLNPTPSSRTQKLGSNLTPILAWGDWIGEGVLTSPSTRQRALVTNLDLLPTILSFFSIPLHPALLGGVLRGVAKPMSWEGLSSLHQNFIFTGVRRPFFVRSFVFFQIFLLALFFLFFLWQRPLMCNLLSFLCRFLFSIPSLVLLLGFYPGSSSLMTLFLLLIPGLFLALFLPFILVRPLFQILFFLFSTIGLLLLDLLFGPYLLSRSLLGYDPIIGARFYGIGNEYMGILLGASIMGGMAWKDSLKNPDFLWDLFLFFSIIILFLGLPFLGANVGGTFSALISFSMTLLFLTRGSFSLRDLGKSLGISFLVLFVFLLLERSILSPFRSHLGRTFHLFTELGIEEIYSVLFRKLGMNMRLLRFTIWTRVLLSFILFLALFFTRPAGFMEKALKEYPYVGLGLKMAVFASLITMLVNDSGVVAMATTLFFPVFSIFYLILEGLK